MRTVRYKFNEAQIKNNNASEYLFTCLPTTCACTLISPFRD